MKPLNILQIVRQFGLVGGMERYVWELTTELAVAGHKVTVLCETLREETAPQDVKVIELGNIRPKPRWLAHLRFSHRVSAWVKAHPDSTRIIHSHERTAVHHATTFHGPPFAAIRNKPIWQRFSPRIYANLWLEKRELCGPQLKAVIPNSSHIAKALIHYYPDIESHLAHEITPGVGEVQARPAHPITEQGGCIGFIGKEWKRKGLDIAVNIVAELRKQRPELEFLVAGPHPDEIRHLFRDWDGGFQLLGEIDSVSFYAQLDLLLHPARQEPYGMVIAEAQAAGVPVLVSDNCGICSELNMDSIMSLNAEPGTWSQRCHALIGKPQESTSRSWKDMAEDQIRCYQEFLSVR